MITLQEALKTPNKAGEIKSKILEKLKNSKLNAYIEKPEIKCDKLPILVKDNISVRGEFLTCASKILQGYKAPYNATVIEKMAKSNLVAFGRANMDEFAMGSTTESSCYGPTLNPSNTACVPGGSSGGSAAAVAGGEALAALGSDTGGSIRQPAGFCGCVGLKPTYGRVSRYGLAAYSSSLDQIGPITQNVADSALLLDIISGYDPLDSTSAQLPSTDTFANLNPDRKFTIAVVPSLLSSASDEVRSTYNDTITTLKAMGHTIIEKTLIDLKYHISAYYIICMAEASSNLARYDGIRYGYRAGGAQNLEQLYKLSRSEGFGEEVKRRILLGCYTLSSGYYDAYYIKAQKMRNLIKSQFNSIFSDADVILYPIAPSVAPRFNTSKTPLEMYLSDIYTISVNLASLPAISIPIKYNDDGLPISIQFIGNKFEEQKILDLALAMELKTNLKSQK